MLILRNSLSNLPKTTIGIIVTKKVIKAKTLLTSVILYLNKMFNFGIPITSKWASCYGHDNLNVWNMEYIWCSRLRRLQPLGSKMWADFSCKRSHSIPRRKPHLLIHLQLHLPTGSFNVALLIYQFFISILPWLNYIIITLNFT
jgi:hypothetical protein